VRLTQGAFSYLPDLTDQQILKQVQYAMDKGWSVGIEWTDDPHPRNSYWDLWGLPLFDCKDASAILYELNECRRLNPDGYIKVVCFDATRGTESSALAFIVQRPFSEPGFYLERQESYGRNLVYTISSYAVQRNAESQRY
jgi:ribulose-bisphosphate carboxylase small chain